MEGQDQDNDYHCLRYT